MPETSEHIPIGDTTLYVRRIGAGNPVFVIHGGPGLNHNYLLPYIDDLSHSNELIYYDQRYCGASESNLDPNKIVVSEFVEDIERLRKQLGYNQISIIAHSFGAHLAFRYAVSYPQHVKKIVSVCGLAISWVGVGLFVREFLKRTKLIKEQLDEIRQSQDFLSGVPAVHTAFYKLIFSSYCYDPCKTENLRLIFTKESARNEVFVSQHLRNQLFSDQFDLTPDLNHLKMPILMIHGIADPFPSEKAKEVADALKNCTYVEFPECGHFPFMEQPALFFKVVGKFLKDTQGDFNVLTASSQESPEAGLK